MPTGRVLLRVTNKHAGRRLRYAQATTRSKTTQHSIHDKGFDDDNDDDDADDDELRKIV